MAKPRRSARTLTRTLSPGNLEITLSGPPEHVRNALTNMRFVQPVTFGLCQGIALEQTGKPSARPADTLGALDLLSPEARAAYAGRCILALKQQTGVDLDADKLQQDSDTTVHQVAEDMLDAATV